MRRGFISGKTICHSTGLKRKGTSGHRAQVARGAPAHSSQGALVDNRISLRLDLCHYMPDGVGNPGNVIRSKDSFP
jgi:hypothetical protein